MSSKSRREAMALTKKTRTSAMSASATAYGVTDELLQDMREVFDVFSSQRGAHCLDAKKMLLAMRALGFEPSRSEVQEMIDHHFSSKSKRRGDAKSAGGRKKPSSGSRSNKKNGGKRSQSRQHREGQKEKEEEEEEEEDMAMPTTGSTTTAKRRSSRRAAQVARKSGGVRSVYVDDSDNDVRSLDDDDDGGDGDEAELDSDDSDAYQQTLDDDDDDEDDDDSMSVDAKASDQDDDVEGLDSEDDAPVQIRLDDFMTIMAPRMRALYDDMEIDRVFQLFDTSGKGAIDMEDLRRVSKELGIAMKDHELREMIEGADKDRDQQVNRGEFAWIMRRIGLLS
ncbi:hypothetical protein DFQ26_007386 [Actinomortierella ambigua]|nr:hypothetical protein DFQ26_007386 [Actinomortierella ambigua]